jgi:DNA invertase Pin-like site-specific DNA recombinase
MGERLAIYTRAPETQAGITRLRRQESICRNWADENGYNVVTVYKTLRRDPHPRWWTKLLKLVGIKPTDEAAKVLRKLVRSGKYDAVVATSVDRYGRDIRAFRRFLRRARRKSVRVFTVDLPGNLTEEIIAALDPTYRP